MNTLKKYEKRLIEWSFTIQPQWIGSVVYVSALLLVATPAIFAALAAIVGGIFALAEYPYQAAAAIVLAVAACWAWALFFQKGD